MLVRVDKDRLVGNLCFVMSSVVSPISSKSPVTSEDGRLGGAGMSMHGISMSDNEYVRLGASGPAIALQTKLNSRWR
jgi:hypothetical protein